MSTKVEKSNKTKKPVEFKAREGEQDTTIKYQAFILSQQPKIKINARNEEIKILTIKRTERTQCLSCGRQWKRKRKRSETKRTNNTKRQRTTVEPRKTNDNDNYNTVNGYTYKWKAIK